MSPERKYQLIHNAEQKQYEFHIDGLLAMAAYKIEGNEIFLIHTEVPDALEGNGVGSALIKAVLLDIEQKGLTLIPLCPFVATYIKKHVEWRKLVKPG